MIYAHQISYKNITSTSIIQNWIKKKNASKVPNNLLKSDCKFEGLGKFKMILTVNIFKILSNH